MAAKACLKVSSFYGNASVPRPYLLLDTDGRAIEGRVDAPRANDALIEWASKVPFQQGGTMIKPVWEGPEADTSTAARNDFQIFMQERSDDIHAANPSLFTSDRKAMLSAASVYWREQLTNEQRAEYRGRAAIEKKQAAERAAEAEAANPKLKTFRERMQAYKRSVGSILSAAKVSAGPLWRVQRRMNANYKLLEDAEGAAATAGGSGASNGKQGRKAGGKKAAVSRGKKATSSKRLMESADDGSSSEEECDEEEAATAADAIDAMQKLLLATAKKPAAKIATHKAAAARDIDDTLASSGSEADDSPPVKAAGGSIRSRSGAVALAGRLGSKGRRGMYADAFELPPSQSTTPTKARGSVAGKKGVNAAAAQALDLPSKSPGKRTRTTRHSLAAGPSVGESPAKKLRSGRS